MNRSSYSASASSSSSSFAPSPSHQSSYPTNFQQKYDVFLSFRGQDTRDNFTSHLYNALDEKKILTFIDDTLVRGEEISPSLLEAIEQSKILVVVLSENYASSKWCLKELVKILDCRRNNGQMIIPVFYRVDPSHVRNQTGSFGAAFMRHEESLKVTKDEVQNWRDALKEVANLSGWDSSVIRPESKLIEKIIEDVLKKLNKTSMICYHRGLVGIHSRIQHIEPLLSLESSNVRIVGIWGMGGLGKTTLARVIYDQISTQFESCCFVSNIREQLKSGRLDQFKKELSSALLEEGNASASTLNLQEYFVEDRLRRKKVLVVVDDVNNSIEQQDLLLSLRHSLGPGSRILATSRDKQVLTITANVIYTMEELNKHEALQLFSMNAFKQDCLPNDRILQAKSVVNYAKGNPLALRVFGSALFDRSDKDWESMLERLGNKPDPKIQDVLKTSYDGLDTEEKRIFLAIACHFIGQSREYVTKILDVAYDTNVHFPITTLIDKSLIVVTYGNKLEMHDLLQEMGKQIAADESKNRTRWLINPEHLNNALMENEANGAIEGISVDMSKVLSEIYLEPDVFENMYNLRFLNFYWPDNKVLYAKVELHLSPQGLRSLPKKLSYLRWTNFPLKSIPPKFFPERLIVLRLQDSKVEKLWDGVKNLVNLIEIDLSKSKYLTEIPDLSKAVKIETIKLHGCRSLVEVHSSIQYLSKLKFFYVGGCKKLKNLPRRIESKALEVLDMTCCLRVKRCPEITQVNMNVKKSYLYGCSNLITRFPGSNFNPMQRLTSLNLEGEGIQELPSSIDHLGYLQSLHLRGCRNLGSLPSCIHRLPQLLLLDLGGCKSLSSLPELPPSLYELDADDCMSLQTISSNFRKCCNLSFANFANCWRLDQKPLEAEPPFTTEKEEGFVQLLYPGSEVPGWVSHQSVGSSIIIQFPSNWDQLMGVVFCIIYEIKELPKELDYLYIEFKMFLEKADNSGEEAVEREEGEESDGFWSRWRKPDDLWSWSCPTHINPDSDHVLIVYDSSYYNARQFKKYSDTEYSFQFCPYETQLGKRIKKFIKVKKCGIHLVQQDYNKKKRKRKDEIEFSIRKFTKLFCSIPLQAALPLRHPVGSSAAAASTSSSSGIGFYTDDAPGLEPQLL